jgi:hypothetical protein
VEHPTERARSTPHRVPGDAHVGQRAGFECLNGGDLSRGRNSVTLGGRSTRRLERGACGDAAFVPRDDPRVVEVPKEFALVQTREVDLDRLDLFSRDDPCADPRDTLGVTARRLRALAEELRGEQRRRGPKRVRSLFGAVRCGRGGRSPFDALRAVSRTAPPR